MRRPSTPRFSRSKQAGERARGATLYITLEPCSHQGRTPPCADALVEGRRGARGGARWKIPIRLVAGQGFRRLHDAGITVEVASEYGEQAAQLNEAFIHSMRTGRPLVTLKAALTLDGKIAAPEDNTGWITSERARAHVQQVRHNSDAILTGIGTVLADDCRLTDRTGLERSRPLLRIVADSTLRIPLDSRMVVTSNGDLAILTTSAASEERRRALEYRGVRVLVFDGPGGRTDLRKLVEYLAGQQYRSLMIESGSKLNWARSGSRESPTKSSSTTRPKSWAGCSRFPSPAAPADCAAPTRFMFHQVKLHTIPPDEFAVEAYVVK